MQGIRHWALTLCICCVLCAALQLLLPDKGASKVIKTVLALYILLSAVSPIPKTDWSDFWQQLKQTPSLEPLVLQQTDELAQKQFEQTLDKRLEELLVQNGIPARVQSAAYLDLQAGTAQAHHVTVVLEQPEQRVKAQDLLHQLLGSTVEIECIAKDEEP